MKFQNKIKNTIFTLGTVITLLLITFPSQKAFASIESYLNKTISTLKVKVESSQSTSQDQKEVQAFKKVKDETLALLQSKKAETSDLSSRLTQAPQINNRGSILRIIFDKSKEDILSVESFQDLNNAKFNFKLIELFFVRLEAISYFDANSLSQEFSDIELKLVEEASSLHVSGNRYPAYLAAYNKFIEARKSGKDFKEAIKLSVEKFILIDIIHTTRGLRAFLDTLSKGIYIESIKDLIDSLKNNTSEIEKIALSLSKGSLNSNSFFNAYDSTARRMQSYALNMGYKDPASYEEEKVFYKLSSHLLKLGVMYRLGNVIKQYNRFRSEYSPSGSDINIGTSFLSKLENDFIEALSEDRSSADSKEGFENNRYLSAYNSFLEKLVSGQSVEISFEEAVEENKFSENSIKNDIYNKFGDYSKLGANSKFLKRYFEDRHPESVITNLKNLLEEGDVDFLNIYHKIMSNLGINPSQGRVDFEEIQYHNLATLNQLISLSYLTDFSYNSNSEKWSFNGEPFEEKMDLLIKQLSHSLGIISQGDYDGEPYSAAYIKFVEFMTYDPDRNVYEALKEATRDL